MIGRTLAHFRIDAKLGEGGMGVVYRATDERLRREVALKVLPESVAADPERRRRFLREARAAAAVTHRNIATVHDIGEADGHVFIAMELVQGETLRARMERAGGRLPEEEALRIATEIAKGLARAHETGVVHRDLKPENVMVTPDGDVKILDFGLAKLFEAEPADMGMAPTASQVTQEGSVMGTPAYMSPEQAEGRADLDARSDVFSFGVMLYEMLAGVLPFEGRTGVAVLYAVVHKEPARLEAVCPEVSAAVARVVARCLEKKSGERFASGREILAALGGDSAARVSSATPGDALPAPRSGGRAPAWALAAVGAVVVSVTAFLGVRAHRDSSAMPSAPTPSVAPPRAASASGATKAVGKPEAVAAYRDALLAYRDGQHERYEALLDEALRLDPSLAAASVARAWDRWLSFERTVEGARRDLAQAASKRETLSATDRAVFDALVAGLTADPPDWGAVSASAKGAAVRFPTDVGLLVVYAIAEDIVEHRANALSLFDKVVELDPEHAEALRMKAQTLDELGELARSAETLDACIHRFPRAVDCFNERMWQELRDGRCEAAEADARRMVAIYPPSFRGYAGLAEGVASQGGAEATVAELLRQAWERARPEVRERDEGLGLARFAIGFGRFGEADAQLAAYSEAHSTLTEELPVAARLRISIAEERGDRAALEKRVTEFLTRQAAWAPDETLLDGRLFAAQRRAGLVSVEEFHAVLGRWRRATETVSSDRELRWISLWASAAVTPEDAREALDAWNVNDAAPPMGPATEVHVAAYWFEVGRTHLLAGKVDEAIAELGRASRSCTTLLDPFLRVRATRLLGDALALKGDTAGACEAYASVISQWGHATPRSVTAEGARDGMKRLRCEAR